MKTEVYSWRLSRGLKSDLEQSARARKVHVSTLLDMAVREWLAKNTVDVADDEDQKRLHASVAPYLGSLRGRIPRRSETVSKTVKEILRRRYGR
jgi:post-segregation antitoxin (ccd killing protein)